MAPRCSTRHSRRFAHGAAADTGRGALPRPREHRPWTSFVTDAQGDDLGDDIAPLAHVIAAAAVEATGTTPCYSVLSGGGSRLCSCCPLLGLARHAGLSSTNEREAVAITDVRGSRRHCSFDEQDRLTGLQMHLVPPARRSADLPPRSRAATT